MCRRREAQKKGGSLDTSSEAIPTPPLDKSIQVEMNRHNLYSTPRLSPNFYLLNQVVTVGLSSEAAILPANSTLVSNTAVGTAALKGVVLLVGAISPRVEQSDVTSSTTSARSKSTDKVTGLEVLPGDGLGDIGEADGVVAGRVGVESHANKAGAVGAVLAAIGVRVLIVHGVRDVARDPELTAGDDLLAADLAFVGRAATAAAGAATTAVLGDHAARAGLHVVVGDVAAVRGLVPDSAALDILTVSLAGEGDVVTPCVCGDDRIVRRGTGAAVDTVAVDGVGIGHGEGSREGHSQVGEMHDGEHLLELDGFCLVMVFQVKGDEDSEGFEVLCALCL